MPNGLSDQQIFSLPTADGKQRGLRDMGFGHEGRDPRQTIKRLRLLNKHTTQKPITTRAETNQEQDLQARGLRMLVKTKRPTAITVATKTSFSLFENQAVIAALSFVSGPTRKTEESAWRPSAKQAVSIASRDGLTPLHAEVSKGSNQYYPSVHLLALTAPPFHVSGLRRRQLSRI